jgi:hypothetical protein
VFAILVLEAALAAPPPKAAGDGRFTVGLGDTILRVHGDGSHADSSPLPDDRGLPKRKAFALTPDGKTVLFTDDSESNRLNFRSGTRLKATAIVGPKRAVSFDDYVWCGGHPSRDGSKYYLAGVAGKDLDQTAPKRLSVFALDLVTQAVVATWALKENTDLVAVTTGGDKQVTSASVVRDGKSVRQLYYGSTDGRDDAAAFAEGTRISSVSVSPTDRHLLAKATDAAGDSRYVVFDLESRAVTPLAPQPDGMLLQRWAWAPDGKRIALLEITPPNSVVGPMVPASPGDLSVDYQIKVVDLTGGNPRIVYRTKGTGVVWDFRWD